MEPIASDSVQGRVGTVLRDKWILGRVIGSGGTATVYEGTHRTNGKRVAVKVLHSYLASSHDVVARFVREGYIANKVGHPGAVAILDDDVGPDGAPYLVMERLDGEALPKLVERQREGLDPAQVLAIADGVLDVLVAAHAQGIVHRDVKPDNVFLTGAGDVKVLDFGIARVLQMTSGVTVDGSALGTPQYMPPEQARGRWTDVDAQSDLWAVGATMFRLLTGRSPREAATTAELLMKAMTERMPRIADVAPWIADEVARVVDRATEPDKGERWPDAKTMQREVREAASRLGVSLQVRSLPVAHVSLPPPAPRARGSKGAGIAMLVAIAGLGFVAWHPLVGSPRAQAAPPREPEPAHVASARVTSAPVPIELPPEQPEAAAPAPEPRPIASHAAHHAKVRHVTSNATPAPTPAASSIPTPYDPPHATEVTTTPNSPLDRRH